VLLTFKTALNIVEATITRETGGSQRSKHLSNVFVVDTNKQPLNTIHPGEARFLLGMVQTILTQNSYWANIVKQDYPHF